MQHRPSNQPAAAGRAGDRAGRAGHDGRTRVIVQTLVAAALLIAVAIVAASARPWPPRPDRALHKAIGAALARQALALLAPQGKLVLITRDTEAFPQPALEILVNSFAKEVGRHSVRIAATQKIQVDPLRPIEAPAGDFAEIIRRAPAGSVIVSLLGPPLLSEEQVARLRPIRPKIVAFCPGTIGESVDLRRLFEAGLLHGALVSRPGSGPAAAPTQSFEELYMPVTTPEQLTSPPSTGPR